MNLMVPAKGQCCFMAIIYIPDNNEVVCSGKAGLGYELLQENKFIEVCMSIPENLNNCLFFRTWNYLIATAKK